MTSKEQRRLQKRKDREKEVSKNLLLKREKLRATTREAKDEFLRVKRLKKIHKELERFDQIMDERQLLEADDKTLSQLEKNIEILKALEAEHERDAAQKEQINAMLEAEGYLTLEEKMEAARKMMLSEQVETDMGMGGSADCKVTPRRDVAEVSVIKAKPEASEENV